MFYAKNINCLKVIFCKLRQEYFKSSGDAILDNFFYINGSNKLKYKRSALNE